MAPCFLALVGVEQPSCKNMVLRLKNMLLSFQKVDLLSLPVPLIQASPGEGTGGTASREGRLVLPAAQALQA